MAYDMEGATQAEAARPTRPTKASIGAQTLDHAAGSTVRNSTAQVGRRVHQQIWPIQMHIFRFYSLAQKILASLSKLAAPANATA